MPDPIYAVHVAPLATAGNYLPDNSDLEAASQTWRAVAQSGQALTEVGLDYKRQHEQAEYHDQLNKGKVYTESKYSELDQRLRNTTDTATWQPELEKTQADIDKYIGTLSNAKAKTDVGQWHDMAKVYQQNSVNNLKWQTDSRNFKTNFNSHQRDLTLVALNAPDPQSYNQAIITSAGLRGMVLKEGTQPGQPLTIDSFEEDKNFNNPLLGPYQERRMDFGDWLDYTQDKRDKAIEKNNLQAEKGAEKAQEIALVNAPEDQRETMIKDPEVIKHMTPEVLERVQRIWDVNDTRKYNEFIGTHAGEIDQILSSPKPDYEAALNCVKDISADEVPAKFRDNIQAYKEKWTDTIQRKINGEAPPMNGLSVGEWYRQVDNMEASGVTAGDMQSQLADLRAMGELGSGKTEQSLYVNMQKHLDSASKSAGNKQESITSKYIIRGMSFAKEMMIPSYTVLDTPTRQDRYEKLEGVGGVRDQLEKFTLANPDASETEIRAKTQELIKESLTATPDIIAKFLAQNNNNAAEARTQLQSQGYIIPTVGEQTKPEGKPAQTKPASKEVDLKTPPIGFQEEEWNGLNDVSKKHAKDILARNDPNEVAQMMARLIGNKK